MISTPFRDDEWRALWAVPQQSQTNGQVKRKCEVKIKPDHVRADKPKNENNGRKNERAMAIAFTHHISLSIHDETREHNPDMHFVLYH